MTTGTSAVDLQDCHRMENTYIESLLTAGSAQALCSALNGGVQVHYYLAWL